MILNITNNQKIEYLFENKILIPISEDFLRYHKSTEIYDSKKDESKIKMILNKVEKVKNYYSPIIESNPKLKLDIKKYFYNVLPYRDIILFNKNEELKIKHKSKNMGHTFKENDALLDLENVSKYLYQNFKNFSKDGLKLRPNKFISAIRYTNLKYKDKIKKDTFIETRIASKYIDINTVGVAFKKTKQIIDDLRIQDLIDVRNSSDTNEKKDNNNYKKFLQKIKKSFNLKESKYDNKILCWLFDTKNDKPILNNFYKLSDRLSTEENISIILGDFYDFWNNLISNYLGTIIMNNINKITLNDIDNILYRGKKKYFNNKNIKNKAYNYYFLKNKENIDKTKTNLKNESFRIKKNIIILPTLNVKTKNKLIEIKNNNNNKNIEETNITIQKCQHYIDWEKIKRMKNKPNEFTQAVFDFVKKYVKTNNKSDFICKSCNEMLAIKKYVYEGSYDPNAEIYYTTNLAITSQLKKIPQYQKLSRIINNLDSIIDSVSMTINNISLYGSLPQIKVKRQSIIKDIIDLIILHTVYLKKEGKQRIEKIEKIYGINRNNTNLFFFELKDEIFITSSNDTDYYKIIKYNNILSYMVFILISDINDGIILNLKEFKKCSYFLFDKYAKAIFNNVFLRISSKDKIPINKFPILCYLLYYFSFILLEYKIWNSKTNLEKDNEFNFIKVQKIIIFTVIDIINGIIEITFNESKNYLYEILGRRFLEKLNTVYRNEKIINKLQTKSKKNFKFDEVTKKISYLTKKIRTLELSGKFDPNISFVNSNQITFFY